jgi:hypothetical protein
MDLHIPDDVYNDPKIVSVIEAAIDIVAWNNVNNLHVLAIQLTSLYQGLVLFQCEDITMSS